MNERILTVAVAMLGTYARRVLVQLDDRAVAVILSQTDAGDAVTLAAVTP